MRFCYDKGDWDGVFRHHAALPDWQVRMTGRGKFIKNMRFD
jgi:hypothetical protein